MKNFAFFAVCVLLPAIFGCTNYGTKLEYGKGELFYTAAVSEAEAKKLGEFMDKTGYFKGDEGKSVQLDKQGTTYEVKFVMSKGAEKDQAAVQASEAMARLISKRVFDQHLVRVHICDDQFKTLKVVTSDQ